MTSILEIIDLDIEEASELLFKVKVEGCTSQSPVNIRLVCEANDLSYMFYGRPFGTDDLVQFNLPIMSSKIQESILDARLEVLIENKYFSPVQFKINFKRPVKVVAESLNVAMKKVVPEIKVTAQPITTKQNVFEEIKKPAPVEVVAPLPTPHVLTLKERYKQNLSHITEETILHAARNFVTDHKKK